MSLKDTTISTDTNFNELNNFSFMGHSFTPIVHNETNEPFFIGKEIADILEIKNLSQAIANAELEDDESTIISNDSGVGGSKMTILSESGLYGLIGNSRKQVGKDLRKFVRKEVLPSIRKTGNFQVSQLSRMDILQIAVQAEQEKQIAEKALIESKDKNRLLETNLESAEATIENIKPLADYGRDILTSVTLYTATNIGGILGLSAYALNKHLKRLHVIRTGTGYTDYEVCMRYCREGLHQYNQRPEINSAGEKITVRHLRWTRKGYDWLISHGDLIKDCNRKSLPLPKSSGALT